MARVTVKTNNPSSQSSRPGLVPENRENQMVSLAYDLVERRLREGTASSQETVHFLKISTREAQLKNEILELEKALTAAKTESLQAQKVKDEVYLEAIKAMRNYSGNGDPDEY